MLQLFIDLGWPAILFWAAVFTGDYFLTLWGAHLYRSRASKVVRFEGSYELTPAYQSDIDAGRWGSRRFLLALATSCVWLVALWWVAIRLSPWPSLFVFGLGVILLREVPVYLRHLQNIVLFRNVGELKVAPGSLIEYPRRLIYRISATDMAATALVNLVGSALLGSMFFLGGAVGCAAVALSHARLSRRQAPPASDGPATEGT